MATFVLSLLITDSLIKEKGCKQVIVGANGPCYIKIVFILLTN